MRFALLAFLVLPSAALACPMPRMDYVAEAPKKEAPKLTEATSLEAALAAIDAAAAVEPVKPAPAPKQEPTSLIPEVVQPAS